jgi:hypothetical protein
MKIRRIIAGLGVLLLIMAFAKTTIAQEKKEKDFNIGGAMRFNILSTRYESPATELNTAFSFDTWLINVKGSKAGIDLDFEYRFYPTSGTHFIHHGYLGYQLNEKLYSKLGVFQKPFGIGKFASHSWWFQGPFYVGLEDDYDIGVGFEYQINDKLLAELAYFRQSEPEGPSFGGDVTFGNSGPGRYSFDITTGNIYTLNDEIGSTVYNESIRELNTFNTRLRYKIKPEIEIGVSAQIGGIYNDYLNEAEIASAFCGHLYATPGNFSFKGEYIYYNYSAKGVSIAEDGSENIYALETVQMGAYGFNNPVAAKSFMYSLSAAYTFEINKGPIETLQVYVDYTLFDKCNSDFENTYHLIPGFMIKAGNVYTYADFAFGKNEPNFTEDYGIGLGKGRTWSNNPDDKEKYYYTDNAELVDSPVPLKDMPWNFRFNLNIGYYF